jgi:antitoxin component YwqK of YwqJK toxin-antitoxin module
LNEEPAYISSIPEEAEEVRVRRYPSGAKSHANYILNGELVGRRVFYESGLLEDESSIRNGLLHGVQYRWYENGQFLSVEPYENGGGHGTAYQWSEDGSLMGTYTLEHGTGLDLWWDDSCGAVVLAEVHMYRKGLQHGWEWWLDFDQESVHTERHWQEGVQHGIERNWNYEGRLRRGYPRYFVKGVRVTKRQYIRASTNDPELPPFRPEDNAQQRTFPSEITVHLGVVGSSNGDDLNDVSQK